MMFLCYTLALGLLAFAYEEPEMFLLVALILAAKIILWRAR